MAVLGLAAMARALSEPQLARTLSEPPSKADPLIPRFVPHNLELELGVIGCLLRHNETFEHVAGRLTADHFYEPYNAQFFALVADCIMRGTLASARTLQHHVEDWEPAGDMTAAHYLAHLTAKACAPEFLKQAVQQVMDLSRKRKFILLSEHVAEMAYSTALADTPRKIIEEIEAWIGDLVDANATEQIFSAKQAADQASKDIFDAMGRGGALAGLPTGLSDLDEIIGGLVPSDLIVLGGRTSMGKTSLAVNMACHAASTGAHVLFFSQEMSAAQIATRVMGEFLDVSSTDLRRGRLTQADAHRVADAANRFGSLPITVDQSSQHTIVSLSNRARFLNKRKGLGLIIVDHIGLMKGTNPRSFSRVNDMGEITGGLKSLARDLNVPLLALAQVNRGTEHREDKRPGLADLRESGTIEMDADVVMFAFREEYYLSRAEPPPEESAKHADWRSKMDACRGVAEILVQKNRHGETATMRAHFDAKTTKFSNLQVRR